MSPEEERLIANYRAGKSVMVKCSFGFMLGMRTLDSGHLQLECPTKAKTIHSPAEAEHVRAALRSWGAALALYDSRKG